MGSDAQSHAEHGLLRDDRIGSTTSSDPVITHQRGLTIDQHDGTDARNHQHGVTELKIGPRDAIERVHHGPGCGDADAIPET